MISPPSASAVNATAAAVAAYAPGTESGEAAMAATTAITIPRLKPRMDDLQSIGKHEYRIPSHPELAVSIFFGWLHPDLS
ncbi:hypothetical protein GCM10009850_074110 [Nonomuraea monospora]|uniref:Uncharacterized protein n=1 Tax=Nonomuraea monospora TaxID=568818 RepID=A0ABP5PJN9_9ACTN